MKNLMWYGICQLYKKKFISIMTIAMLALSFIILEYAGIQYFSFRYSEIMADSVLEYDSEDIYNINVSKYAFAAEEEIKQLTDFYKAFCNIEGMECYGMYFEWAGSDDEAKYMYISDTLAQMCGVYLGSKVDSASDGFGYAAVGKNVSGTHTIGSEVSDPNTMEDYRIETELDAGSQFISDSYIQTAGRIVSLDDYIVMDFEYLIERQPVFILNALNNFYFVVSSDADYEAVCAEIEELAIEYNIDIYGINSMKVLFENSARKAAYEAGERYLMPFVMLICSLLAMSIATLISMRTNRRDMGIMLANGMTRMDITVIYIFENILKILVSYVLSLVFWKVNAIFEVLNFELQRIILLMFLFVAVVVAAISSITPMLYMKNKIPCQLIGEDI